MGLRFAVVPYEFCGGLWLISTFHGGTANRAVRSLDGGTNERSSNSANLSIAQSIFIEDVYRYVPGNRRPCQWFLS